MYRDDNGYTRFIADPDSVALVDIYKANKFLEWLDSLSPEENQKLVEDYPWLSELMGRAHNPRQVGLTPNMTIVEFRVLVNKLVFVARSLERINPRNDR